MKQSMWMLTLTLATITITAPACKEAVEASGARDSDPVPVTLASSRFAPVQRDVKVVGTLYGDEEATVSAKVPGRITQILRDVGDRAAPGEPLAQIDKTDYELAAAQKRMAVQAALAKLGIDDFPPEDFDLNRVPTVERARLQSENAQAKFRRGEQLFQQNPPLISEQDFADLKTTYEVARSNYDVELLTARSLLADARARKSELDQDLQRLSDTMVRAPLGDGIVDRGLLIVDGAIATTAPFTTNDPQTTNNKPQSTERFAIASRLVSVGEYVREGTALFRLVADDPIKFRAQVPEKFLGQVKVGQTVRLKIDAFADVFTGNVSRISPQVDIAARSFQVEMLVPNPDGRLQPGAFAAGAILTRVDPQVTLVPIDALITFAGVTKVFTVADGKAVEKRIETGQRIGDEIEVISGLSGVAPVVIEGAGRLATDVPVTISPSASTAPASTQPLAAK